MEVQIDKIVWLIDMAKFIGRKEELARLNQIASKKTASFIVVKGRRRIGKSRLIEEFGKSFDNVYTFSGLPPEKKITAKEQLKEFSNQISNNFNIPNIQYDDWSKAFWSLSERITKGKILLFFDEISWMGSEDNTFLGKIKDAWDKYFKKNDNLVFVICESASSWIEKNLLSNSGFVGRVSLTLTLRELTLSECKEFWNKNISAYEKLKVLAITGGIPKYLEEVNTNLSAEENITNLCFKEGGFLVEEFDRIFSDIFLRKSSLYKDITRLLAEGPKTQEKIIEELKLPAAGRLSEYLFELELAGFISRDYAWNINTGDDSKLSRYRLKDNYLRFYVKYIEKNKNKISHGIFKTSGINKLPNWHTVMGLQFENLILNQKEELFKKMNINVYEIIAENPYFQKKNKRQEGCQIDWMIQTKFDTLYVCEIKFSKHPIGAEVISEIENKIAALNCRNRFSLRPVLIHVNGVSQDIKESDFFASIIDAKDLF